MTYRNQPRNGNFTPFPNLILLFTNSLFKTCTYFGGKKTIIGASICFKASW